MMIVLNRSYRKLILAIAVTCIVILVVHITNLKESFENEVLTFLHPNQLKYLGNASKPDKIISVHNDIMIPGKYTWIPYPVKRNPSGPFIIRINSGEAITYTNYTFFPLTFNSSFLINNPNICKDAGNLTFLIMVHTAVPHFDQRRSLRDTWANSRLLKNHQSRILFLVGRTKGNTFQKLLEMESETFKDIVQGDFIDDYHNLTHTGIIGYRWIVNYCENAKFVLKIDDDMFVNIFLVIHELLPMYQKVRNLVACRLLANQPIAREGKFAVDPDYFPGYQRSPVQYCAGPFVLMLRSIVPEMYEAAKSSPFYWVDDLYLFGVLPNQVRDVSFHVVGNIDNEEDSALKCFQGEKKCTYLAAYAWTEGVMYKYWNATLVMYKDLVQKYANKVWQV